MQGDLENRFESYIQTWSEVTDRPARIALQQQIDRPAQPEVAPRAEEGPAPQSPRSEPSSHSSDDGEPVGRNPKSKRIEDWWYQY